MQEYLALVADSGQVNTPPGSYETVKEWIREAFVARDSHVLEVGCSTGFITIEMARYTGASCVGLDAHRGSLVTANKNIDPYVRDRVRFVEGDAGRTPFEKQSFSHTVIGGHLPFVPASLRWDHVSETVRVTQCVGYYLEAAAHAVGPVYNMGPSFRGERSKSRRHLMEYWHVKAELLDGDLETIMALTEDLVSTTIEACREEGERVAALLGTRYACKEGEPPYQRIGYRDAITFLQKQGHKITFGEGISGDGEVEIGKIFGGPFWIVGNPRTIEPFPYVIDPNDPELTMTADLISPEGFGELLGTAEKIVHMDMLDERMAEKGKAGDPRYAWIRQMREFGMVPHIAFGMGLERFLRWLVGASHVRDTIPFPRVFHRPVHP